MSAIERAGLVSLLYVVCYLGLGVPAVLAGFGVVHGGGQSARMDHDPTAAAAARAAVATLLDAALARGTGADGGAVG